MNYLLSVFKMSRSLAFLVVAVLLCVILSSRAADGLQCRGERLRNGAIFFNASYEVGEDVHDCETQWLVDDKVAGFSDADGYTEVMPPIITATANTATLQTCPEKLQCLLICPSSSINKKEQCLCDTTPPTTLPEVGFQNWSIGVLIGAGVLLVPVIVTILLCWKKQRPTYSPGRTGSDEDLPV